MIIGKVIGHVWATRKDDSLSGLKMMVVQRTESADNSSHESFVAVDCVSAGIGDGVLVVTGSAARKAMTNENIPVDAAIVGIIDQVEVCAGA